MIVAAMAFGGLALASCGNDEPPVVDPDPSLAVHVPSPEPTPEPTPPPTPTPAPVEVNFPEFFYTFDDYVVLGSFAVKFIDEVSFDTITDPDSGFYGAEVVRVPISIENISHTQQNPNTLAYFVESPAGNTLESISEYFSTENIGWAGSMSMASNITTHLHFLYEGSGLYQIWFEWLVDLDFPVALPIFR